MSFHSRLKEKLEEKKLKPADLARGVDVSSVAVGKWVHGDSIPKAEKLKAISKFLNVSDDWLLTGRENGKQENHPVLAWDAPEDLDPNVYVIIPHVDIKFSAGNGRIVEFEPSEKEQGSVRLLEWVHKKQVSAKNLITVDIDGDSMEPRIPDGSIVTLDKSINSLDQVQSGRVYAIRYGNELKIKRLSRRFDGALIIDSDNPQYQREIVEPEQLEHISVIGKYVSHSYDGEI